MTRWIGWHKSAVFLCHCDQVQIGATINALVNIIRRCTADIPSCVLCIISRGSSLYFLRYIVTLTRYSRRGWRWLEKPERLYTFARARVFVRCWLATLQLSVPGYSLYSPLISELYYSITHGGRRNYYNHSALKNTSSINQPASVAARLLENRVPISWFYLPLNYIFHAEIDSCNCDWLSSLRYYVTVCFRIQS